MDNFEIDVNGAVRSAGVFNYGDGITLGDALLLAGGLTQSSVGGKIQISSIVDYDPVMKQLSPKRAIVKTFPVTEKGQLPDSTLAYQLKPYDQVSVRANPEFEKVRTVELTGEVNFPGTYTLLSKDESITDLIKRAGGLKPHADTYSTQIYRWIKN